LGDICIIPTFVVHSSNSMTMIAIILKWLLRHQSAFETFARTGQPFGGNVFN
jgi:hypothetical protein